MTSVVHPAAVEVPTSVGTIVDAFEARVREHPGRPALFHRSGSTWSALTWADYGAAVSEVAAGLVALGARAGDRIGILSANRPEWHVCDLGVLTAGCVSVPLYQTSSPSQVGYVLQHSGSRFCVVEDREQLAKVAEVRGSLPELEHVIVLNAGGTEGCVSLDWLRTLGREHLQADQETLEEHRGSVRMDGLATLVYTSGTTGPPKGVAISHRNIMWTIRSVIEVVPVGPADRFFSYLPLSHIAERTVSHMGQIIAGGQTWFARSLQTIPEDLPACRPTIFFGVPRVWQKLRQRITEEVSQLGGVKGRVAGRYLALADVAATGATMTRRQRATLIALDQTVGTKLRRQLGLDQARVLVTAAAPIHPSLLRWFAAIGLPIIEVYGQTEDCGPTTINPPGRARLGSVGLPIPGVTVRIADDGEVLVRGGNVCEGYYRNPAATAALIDGDGWMHSGDVGHVDADGYLYITDRKKDLIINAAGKNIAPQEIETRLRAEPLISQAVVIGEARPYLTALLTLDAEALRAWSLERDKPAAPEALLADPDLRAEIAASVDRVNAEHSRVEGIKRWTVLPVDLSIDADELTPTLKVKRAVVNDHYAEAIEAMYEG
jgi:long-chain acyl-CoA synthetase